MPFYSSTELSLILGTPNAVSTIIFACKDK